ncbi:hypothetical protein V6N12_007456 [Hibiscus sabdariffa]|uniref:Uncharacterized protein n=1 Tax=Hibiscus sabdariffa TaxID=183260 RepID=A0ABR2F1U0_9ROSI
MTVGHYISGYIFRLHDHISFTKFSILSLQESTQKKGVWKKRALKMIKEIPEIHWRVQKLRLGGQENDEYQWRLGRQGLQGKAPARFRYWRAYESKMTLRNQRLVLHHHRYPRKKKKKKKISTISKWGSYKRDETKKTGRADKETRTKM